MPSVVPSELVLPAEEVQKAPVKCPRRRITSLTDTPQKMQKKHYMVEEMRKNLERRPESSATSWLSSKLEISRASRDRRPCGGGGSNHLSTKAPGTGSSKSPIPSYVLEDGFVLPQFDSSRLLSMSPVGHGSQAIVYRARIPKTNQLIAVKVLREELAKKNEERRAFEREVQLLARLIHPHINNVIGIDRVGVLPCAMLEWCQIDVNQALLLDDVGADPHLRRDVINEWPAYERIRLAFELASALRFLHSGTALKGGVLVCHRDIKPANTGIDATGKLKLLDFGLAVCFEPGKCSASSSVQKFSSFRLSRSSLTRADGTGAPASTMSGRSIGAQTSGQNVVGAPPIHSNEFYFQGSRETGTRRYMAPEVCRGDLYGTSADVFSFAITIWEIFALRGRPFNDIKVEVHTSFVVNGNLRPTIPTTWHPTLQDVCNRAWRRDKRLRPNMDELFNTLFDFYKQGTLLDPNPPASPTRSASETSLASCATTNSDPNGDSKPGDPLVQLSKGVTSKSLAVNIQESADDDDERMQDPLGEAAEPPLPSDGRAWGSCFCCPLRRSSSSKKNTSRL